MPNSYPRDGIFNQYLKSIKYSYILVFYDLEMTFYIVFVLSSIVIS